MRSRSRFPSGPLWSGYNNGIDSTIYCRKMEQLIKQVEKDTGMSRSSIITYLSNAHPTLIFTDPSIPRLQIPALAQTPAAVAASAASAASAAAPLPLPPNVPSHQQMQSVMQMSDVQSLIQSMTSFPLPFFPSPIFPPSSSSSALQTLSSLCGSSVMLTPPTLTSSNQLFPSPFPSSSSIFPPPHVVNDAYLNALYKSQMAIEKAAEKNEKAEKLKRALREPTAVPVKIARKNDTTKTLAVQPVRPMQPVQPVQKPSVTGFQMIQLLGNQHLQGGAASPMSSKMNTSTANSDTMDSIVVNPLLSAFVKGLAQPIVEATLAAETASHAAELMKVAVADVPSFALLDPLDPPVRIGEMLVDKLGGYTVYKPGQIFAVYTLDNTNLQIILPTDHLTALTTDDFEFNVLRKLVLWQSTKLKANGLAPDTADVLGPLPPREELNATIKERIYHLKECYVQWGSAVATLYREDKKRVNTWIQMAFIPKHQMNQKTARKESSAVAKRK